MTSPLKFRNIIPSPDFRPERGRYVLYINYCCPWAHRAIIVRELKGLQDVIQLVEADGRDPTHGWMFSGWRGPDRDPVTGVKYVKELYLRADPGYDARITIPVLWDRRNGTVVNNDSGEIMRMFIHAFDDLVPAEKREVNKGPAAFVPDHLRTEIDTLNAWVYDTVNNGVYKAGFARSQEAYDEHVTQLFQSLDRLEHHLSQPGHQPYLFGAFITEADIRLFTTIIRFDVAYYTLFKCNLKMIRVDYPRLHTWLRTLYWGGGPGTADGAFKNTTFFDVIKRCYASTAAGNKIVPVGPSPHILPL